VAKPHLKLITPAIENRTVTTLLFPALPGGVYRVVERLPYDDASEGHQKRDAQKYSREYQCQYNNGRNVGISVLHSYDIEDHGCDAHRRAKNDAGSPPPGLGDMLCRQFPQRVTCHRADRSKKVEDLQILRHEKAPAQQISDEAQNRGYRQSAHLTRRPGP
jgi:hypothetical protein